MIAEEYQGVYSSFAAAVFDVQKRVSEGWKVVENENSYPVTVGFNYEVNFIRYVEGEVVGRPLTRAEILAKARAAKKEKNATEAGNVIEA